MTTCVVCGAAIARPLDEYGPPDAVACRQCWLAGGGSDVVLRASRGAGQSGLSKAMEEWSELGLDVEELRQNQARDERALDGLDRDVSDILARIDYLERRRETVEDTIAALQANIDKRRQRLEAATARPSRTATLIGGEAGR